MKNRALKQAQKYAQDLQDYATVQKRLLNILK